MTISTDLIDKVHILRRELEKLELEKRIAQLKAEPFIDEGCVGCAGPCMVVDVAANLQQELDECRSDLSMCHEIIGDRDKTIKDFKTIETRETDRLHKIIEDLTSDRQVMEHELRVYRRAVNTNNNTIKGLDAELSARRKDSEVLMKVVEAIRDWISEPLQPRFMITRIHKIIGDYLDAPEGPPETPIDDLYTTRVSVFLEMP